MIELTLSFTFPGESMVNESGYTRELLIDMRATHIKVNSVLYPILRLNAKTVTISHCVDNNPDTRRRIKYSEIEHATYVEFWHYPKET